MWHPELLQPFCKQRFQSSCQCWSPELSDIWFQWVNPHLVFKSSQAALSFLSLAIGSRHYWLFRKHSCSPLSHLPLRRCNPTPSRGMSLDQSKPTVAVSFHKAVVASAAGAWRRSSQWGVKGGARGLPKTSTALQNRHSTCKAQLILKLVYILTWCSLHI